MTLTSIVLGNKVPPIYNKMDSSFEKTPAAVTLMFRSHKAPLKMFIPIHEEEREALPSFNRPIHSSVVDFSVCGLSN